VLLVEEAALDAVGVALERERAVAQVRQQDGRDREVEADQVALREARSRVEDLVEVRESQAAPLQLDLDAAADSAAGGDERVERGAAACARGRRRGRRSRRRRDALAHDL